MSDTPYISIVTTVSPSISEVRSFLEEISKQNCIGRFEVVLVDDLGILEKNNDCFNFPANLDVSIIETGRVGHLNASVLGFGQARGDIIISIDPDMGRNISDIPRFVHEAENGALLVYGVRVFRGDVSMLRFFFSRLYNKILKAFFYSPVRDINVPMILVGRKLVEDILSYKGEFGYLKLFMPNKLGPKFSEIEIEVVCDKKGRSAYSFFSLLALLLAQLKEIFRYRMYARCGGKRNGG